MVIRSGSDWLLQDLSVTTVSVYNGWNDVLAVKTYIPEISQNYDLYSTNLLQRKITRIYIHKLTKCD